MAYTSLVGGVGSLVGVQLSSSTKGVVSVSSRRRCKQRTVAACASSSSSSQPEDDLAELVAKLVSAERRKLLANSAYAACAAERRKQRDRQLLELLLRQKARNAEYIMRLDPRELKAREELYAKKFEEVFKRLRTELEEIRTSARRRTATDKWNEKEILRNRAAEIRAMIINGLFMKMDLPADVTTPQATSWLRLVNDDLQC
eukprot:jgi/Chlat1/7582/Chrsp63S07069